MDPEWAQKAGIVFAQSKQNGFGGRQAPVQSVQNIQRRAIR